MSTDHILDRHALAAALAAGARVKWLFFWGHTPPADGAIGRHVLSQWWPAEFEIGRVRYPTAEHWMMAEKARLFGDRDAEKAAINAGHPAEAKQAGRHVRGFDDAIWAAHRFEVVVTGNVAKFGQHDDLRIFLISTRDRVLVEASPRDRVWGIGMSESNEHAMDPARWRGGNLLGFALMKTRATLRDDSV